MRVEEVERSLPKKILGIAWLTMFTVGPLYGFAYFFHQLITDTLEPSDLIVFNKGAMYLLGGGLGIGVLTVFLVADAMKKKLSQQANKKATRLLLFFFGLFLALPHLMDFGVHRYIERINYVHCEDQSHQWFHVRTYVFATDLATCTTYRSEDRDEK